MLDRMATVLGVRRRPKLPVPLLTPWLSSLWIGLVTPADAGVARPLIEGLASPTVVDDPGPASVSRCSRFISTRRCAGPSPRTTLPERLSVSTPGNPGG
jgi:hypothetical protein